MVVVAGFLVAQDTGIDAPSAIGTLIAAVPVIGVLWYWLRREQTRGDKWEDRYLALSESTANQVVPLVREAQRIVAEVAARPVPDAVLLQTAERVLRDTIERAERAGERGR